MRSLSASETETEGRKLGESLRKGDVVSLRGSLGAGKTVLAKGIAESLGITEAIVSPTFTIVQEYSGREKLYHLDLYRLSGDDEITLIEWSEKIDDMLPDNTIFVNITISDDGSRNIDITRGRR